MLTMLEAQPESALVPHSVRTMFVSPGPTPERRDKLESRFGLRIVTGYGMTECTFGCFETATSRPKAGSSGSPRQPVDLRSINEMRIVAEGGHDVAVGGVGEILFRNEFITRGYWRNAEASAALIRNGWLHTGDLGRIDEDGDLFIAGRLKEMIRRRGENIAPAEIEDVLLEHPTVRVAAVFGVPSQLTEEEVVACVVLNPDSTLNVDDLRRHCALSLAPYKVPTEIYEVEVMPVTATMRVARERLRAEYGDRLRGGTEGSSHD
jgi:crotonobetaine/carnitine-CoA ligase